MRGMDRFRDLPGDDLRALGQRCCWRRLAPQEQIIHLHDESRDVYFVVEGEVRAITYSLDGKEVTYRHIAGGGRLGEFSAIDGDSRSANVVALKPSLVAAMSASVFWGALERHASISALTGRVFELSTLAVKNRTPADLLRLARDHMAGEAIAVIAPTPKHAEIASRISTNREAVARYLSELARAGLIERRGGSLVIQDVPALARVVQQVLGK